MPSIARALSAAERNTVSALRGHNFYCYLAVTDADGSWRNVGALATGGGKKRNFFNSATLSDGIDQNTLSFGAILARNISNYSLSPFRSNSPLNSRANGTLGIFLDIRRYWRLWACVMPIGVKPGAGNYRPMAEGRIDSIDVQDEAATITIAGRGMEADLIDSYVMVKTRTYGDDAAPVAVEDVIQQMIDDQLGAGNYPVFAPEAPVGLYMPKWNLDEGALMPSVLTSAALAAQVVRYRYDASDVNRLTQFTPARDVTVPDWEFGHREWKSRAVKIDIQGVRNYLKATYPDPVLGTNTVISPAPEPSTVTVAGELATFSVSPGATLADAATIVINDVGYIVSAYDAGAGTATLAGAPDVAGAKWYTSASITKYGVRPMLIDLTQKNRITDELKVGAFLDAIRSDMEDPSLESSVSVKGVWFIQLHDYVRLLPDGEVTNEVTYGGVTGYSHTFSNGMLESSLSLRGKPSGGYTRWLKLGSGAPRVIEPPAILSYSADYWEEYDGSGVLIRGGVGDIGSVNDRVRSVAIEVGTDPTLTLVEFIEYTDILPPVTIFAHQWEGASRGQVYYFRATPWSGPLVAGLPTGVPGVPWTARTYNDVLRPTQPQFDDLSTNVDTIDADLSALGAAEFVMSEPSASAPNGRRLEDSADGALTFDRSSAGLIIPVVSYVGPPAGSGALSVYQTIVKTTGVLADGASQTILLDIAPTVAFQQVQVSAAAWVRMYHTLAALNADIGRSILTDPVGGSSGEPIFECAPGAGGTSTTLPLIRNVVAHNGDAPRVGRFYMRVTNKSGGAAAITVTIRYLPLEGSPAIIPGDTTGVGMLYEFDIQAMAPVADGTETLSVPNTGTLGGNFTSTSGFGSGPKYKLAQINGKPAIKFTQIGGNTRHYNNPTTGFVTPTESHIFAIMKTIGGGSAWMMGPDATFFPNAAGNVNDNHQTSPRSVPIPDPSAGPFLYYSHSKAGLWEADVGLTNVFSTAVNTVSSTGQNTLGGHLAGGFFANVFEGIIGHWRFYSGAYTSDEVLGIKLAMLDYWEVSP